MQLYLPIAEMSLNIFLLLGMGAGVTLLSGLFGVGGGFLMTPLLIFTGVPPAVAVGTEANQIVAASVSGVLAHWRRGTVSRRSQILSPSSLSTVSTVARFFASWCLGVDSSSPPPAALGGLMRDGSFVPDSPQSIALKTLKIRRAASLRGLNILLPKKFLTLG